MAGAPNERDGGGKPSLDRTRSALGEDGARGTRVHRVAVVHGPSRGAFQILDRVEHVVGRAGFVDGPLGLGDSEVSKHHARFAWDAAQDAFVLEDLGSRNGTYLNGERVVRRAITTGGVVRIGSSLLLYEDAELPAYVRLEPESDTLPGPSLSMQRVRGEIALVATQPIAVLVLGASGVGKELVAGEIHRASGRAGPFVPVNCAAIAREVAESEIFGHTAGAFTGAARAHEGLFVSAQGGTLFLDEIGEMAVELQAKLLRALATGEVRAVGASHARRVDVRVVAATNRELDAAVAAGTFRGDLLARLQGWTIRVPPLSERRQDVLPLARRFLARAPGETPLAEPTADAAEALLLADWPYNVRELEQTCAAALVRGAGPTLKLEHLLPAFGARLRDRAPATSRASVPPPLELVVPRDRPPTKDELVLVIERHGGNMAEVAEYFRKDRRQVYRWAERWGVDLERFRKS